MVSPNKSRTPARAAAEAAVKKPSTSKVRAHAKALPVRARQEPESARGGVADEARAVADKRRPHESGPSDAALLALKAEVAGLRALLARPAGAAPTGPDAEVDALRRAVNDLLERRMESVVRDLVALRGLASELAGADPLLAAADALLTRLGAIRYDAHRLDHVDPLIHAVSRETQSADLPDGVIAASLRPGFRTSRGVVLAKAQVAVNRRP